MKKTLLGILFMTVFGIFTVAQTTYCDFETLDLNFVGFGGAAYEAAANPDAAGINTSDNVGKATTGNETWAGMGGDNLGGTVDLSTDTEFKMKVYSENTGVVMLKLELQSDYENHNMEVKVDYTTANAWQELTFDFAGGEDKVYDHIVVFFDMDVADVGEIWYFDDIVGTAFVPGSDVEVTFQVTDLDDASTSVEVELSTDPGTKVALTNDGTGVWTTSPITMAGSTFSDKKNYTYSLYVDGTILAEQTDVELKVAAGSAPMTIPYTFGGGVTDEALASYFGLDFPIIDGEYDDTWDNATEYPITLPFGTEGFEDEADLNGYFKVGWDENGIYMLVESNDDYSYPSGDHGQDWEKDKVEVYFDTNLDDLKDGAGPSAATGGNGGDNGHFQIAPGFIAEWVLDKTWMTEGSVEWGWVTTATAEGDAYNQISECYVPWEAIPDKDGNVIVPSADIVIGLGATLCDNDGADNDNTNARNRLVWSNASGDESWANMDGCGTMMLDYTGVSVKNSTNSQFRMYPNPAKDVLNISNAAEVSSVTIRNILGAEVMHVVTSGETLSINTSDLNSGIYIISLENETGVLSNNKFVVK